jgi:hypothetical protein
VFEEQIAFLTCVCCTHRVAHKSGQFFFSLFFLFVAMGSGASKSRPTEQEQSIPVVDIQPSVRLSIRQPMEPLIVPSPIRSSPSRQRYGGLRDISVVVICF